MFYPLSLKRLVMRILFIGTYKSNHFYEYFGTAGDPGIGGQRKMQALLLALCIPGHEVQVVSSAIPHNNGTGCVRLREVSETVDAATFRVHHVPIWVRKPIGGLVATIMSPILALHTARRYCPAVVVSYNAHAAESIALIALKCVLRSRIIIIVDDLPSVRRSTWHPKRAFDRLFWPIALKLSDGFALVNSRIISPAVIGSRPSYVVPGVVDANLSQMSGSRKRPFSSRPFVALYAGGLADYRGVDVLRAAVASLPPGWILHIAGAGPLAPAFKALAQAHPERCQFLGLLSPKELHDALCSCDAAVNTLERLSLNDGVFPFKIIEYIVAGAQLVTPSLPHVDGLDLGWATPWDGQADSFAAALCKAEADFAGNVLKRKKCLEHVLNTYSCRAVSATLESLIKKTCARDKVSNAADNVF